MGSRRVGHDWVISLSLTCIREGNGSPLQCSCLENPRDSGAWRAAIYGVAQSRTWLKWLSCSSSNIPEWSSGFLHFLQFKSEFCYKEFMIRATVSSWSCFCWLYRASPSSAAKNIINLILVLTIWSCWCVESSLVLLEKDACYDQCVLLTNCFSLYPASFCILRPNFLITTVISWLPPFAIQSPMMKRTSFLVLVLEVLVGLQRTIQL